MTASYYRMYEMDPELAYIFPIKRADDPLNIGAPTSMDADDLPLQARIKRLTPAPPGHFYPDYYLMSLELADVLKGQGIDNLQLFPSELIDEDTNQKTDYWTFNILGLVACADISASEVSPLGDTHFFHRLVIQTPRTGSLLLFRLAESLSDIVVHETVASAIAAAGLSGVAFDALEATG